LAENLGEKKDFYSKKLHDIHGIRNNLPTAQFRNYCESFVKISKKMIKQGIQGGQGMQMDAIEYPILELILEGAPGMVNQVPYLDGSNVLEDLPLNLPPERSGLHGLCEMVRVVNRKM
jgi:hypothetical protein